MGRRTISAIEVTDVEKRRQPSKHYVYVITVSWSDGSIQTIYRRYSRFFDFQNDLLDKFPDEAGKDDPNKRTIPFLPGKKFFGRSHIREVAEKRLQPINDYCKTLINLPVEISCSEEVLGFFETEQQDVEPLKERRESKAPKGKKISGPKLLEDYVAIADYAPQGKGEISLTQGMSIEVAEKTETGWWFVTCDDEQGWVPSTYLQRRGGEEDHSLQTSEPGQEEDYVAISVFEATGDDEVDLEIGTVVLVLEKNLQGWWKVRLNNKEGYVPAAYLSKADSSKVSQAQRDNNRLSQGVQVVSSLSEISEFFKPSNSIPSPAKTSFKQPPPRTHSLPRGSGPDAVSEKTVKRVKEYRTIESFQDTMADGISFSSGQAVQVLEKNPSGWWYVEIGGQEGWAPAAYIQLLPSSEQKDDKSDTESSSVFSESSQWDEDEDTVHHPPNMSALAGDLEQKMCKGKSSTVKSNGPPPPPAKPKAVKSTIDNDEDWEDDREEKTVSDELMSALALKNHSSSIKPKGPPPPPSKPKNMKVFNPSTSDDEGDWEDGEEETVHHGLNISALAGALKQKLEESSNNQSSGPPPPPSKPTTLKPSNISPKPYGTRGPDIPVKPLKPPAMTTQLPSKPSHMNTKPSVPSKKPSINTKPSIPSAKPTLNSNVSNKGDELANVLQSRFKSSQNGKSQPPAPPSKSLKPGISSNNKPSHKASASFTPENPGEITLVKGAMVTVIQADDSGWWLVKSAGQEGWVPATYLQEIDSNDNPTTAPSSVSEEITNKFGARLKPVSKPIASQASGKVTGSNVKKTALLPGGKGKLPPVPH